MVSLWEDWFWHRHEGGYRIKTLRHRHRRCMWRWRLELEQCCHKVNARGYWILGEVREVISRDTAGRLHWWCNGVTFLEPLWEKFLSGPPIRTPDPQNSRRLHLCYQATYFVVLCFSCCRILTLTIKCRLQWSSPKALPSDLESSGCWFNPLTLGCLLCGNVGHNVEKCEKSLWERGVSDDTDEYQSSN